MDSDETRTAGETPTGHKRRERLRREDRIGRFAVIDRLGSGGMGVVYAAYDPSLDRRVAIKLLWPDRTTDRGLKRLKREAQALAQIAHPNVVEVLDVGQHEGRLYVAMELVDGTTLREWSERREHGIRELCDVLEQAGRGLAAAHARGLVHRDFKPDNVLVGKDGRVRVLDFGLVRLGRSDGAESNVESGNETPMFVEQGITHGGRLLGTPAYMAPEQRMAASVDERADQFSFCVTCYRLLFRQRPYRIRKGPPERSITMRDLPSSPPLSRALRRALVRGLSVRPSERYATLGPILDALHGVARPTRARWTAAALSVTAVASVVVAWPESTSSCLSARGVDGIWDTKARDQAADALRNRASWGQEAATLLGERLDSYADTWDIAHDAACEAATSDTRADARFACLADRRDALADLVGAIREQRMSPGAATEEAALLPAVALCERAAWLDALVKPPEDPATATNVARVRTGMMAVRGALSAGDYGGARERLVELTELATMTDYAPVQAELALLRAQLASDLGARGESREALTEAYDLAIASHQAPTAVEAASELARQLASARDLEAARRWVRFAEAAVERAGLQDFDLAAKVSTARSGVAVAEEDYQTAVLHAEDALAIQRRHGNGAAVASAHAWLAAVVRRTDPRRSIAEFETAIALASAALGSVHPRVGTHWESLGVSLTAAGEFDRAVEARQRALKILRDAYGPTSPAVLVQSCGLVDALVNLERMDAALELVDQVPPELLEAVPMSPTERADCLRSFGKAFFYSKRRDEAERALTRAAVITESVGADPRDLVADLNNLSALKRSRGEPEQALEYAQRALEAADGHALEPTLRATLYLTVANCLGSLERWAEAAAAARAGLGELDESVAAGAVVRIKLHITLADALRELDDRPGAIAAHREAVRAVATRAEVPSITRELIDRQAAALGLIDAD